MKAWVELSIEESGSFDKGWSIPPPKVYRSERSIDGLRKMFKETYFICRGRVVGLDLSALDTPHWARSRSEAGSHRSHGMGDISLIVARYMYPESFIGPPKLGLFTLNLFQ